MGQGKSYQSFEGILNEANNEKEKLYKKMATGGHPTHIYVEVNDPEVCDFSSMYPSYIPKWYNMKWTLRDDWGNKWVEVHNSISIEEFEIIYGNNVYTITKFKLTLVKT